MKAIGLCSAFNRMSNLKHSLTGFWLGLEKKMQLIRLFLNLPLCLMAVDLQIVACWESQTLWSVLLSGGEGSFPLMGLRLHLSSVTVPPLVGTVLPGNAWCHHTLCAPWEMTRDVDEPGFLQLALVINFWSLWGWRSIWKVPWVQNAAFILWVSQSLNWSNTQWSLTRIKKYGT